MPPTMFAIFWQLQCYHTLKKKCRYDGFFNKIMTQSTRRKKQRSGPDLTKLIFWSGLHNHQTSIQRTPLDKRKEGLLVRLSSYAKPKNSEELWQAAKNTWENRSLSRCNEVIKGNGGAISY